MPCQAVELRPDVTRFQKTRSKDSFPFPFLPSHHLYLLHPVCCSPQSIMVAWKLPSLLLLSLGALNAFAAIDVSSPRLAEP
jgi:hypothetical protein